MPIIHGRNIIIKKDGTPLAASKSCTIDITADMLEVSSPQRGSWKYYRKQRKGWRIDTNHLIMNVEQDALSVGTEVQLSVDVTSMDGAEGLPFEGFVHDVIVQQTSTTASGTVVYDDVTNRFVLKVRPLSPRYYQHWQGDEQYVTPTSGAYFLDTTTQTLYRWFDESLMPATTAMTGSAFVREFKCTATVGDLAQGSFSFLGNGPLE